jgi:hypothetical protein
MPRRQWRWPELNQINARARKTVSDGLRNEATQSEAERAARDIAINQRSEVLIHGENGRIRERNSYGNDPHPPKG